MAPTPRPPALTDAPDLIDPATEDWAEQDDGAVWEAARAGVEEASVEARARGLVVP